MVIAALLAGVAMFVQDIFSVLMVQAEARNKAHLAASLDSLGWGATIATTAISVTTLQGHSMPAKVLTVLLVTAANYGGTLTGVLIGRRFVKDEDKANVSVLRGTRVPLDGAK